MQSKYFSTINETSIKKQDRTIVDMPNRIHLSLLLFLILSICFQRNGIAEGTKQLEPLNAPENSYCRLTIAYDDDGDRIPFALVDCSEEYRLNIRVDHYTNEKIYLGFGNLTDYGINPYPLNDVHFQVKDPSGNIVAGYTLKPTPHYPGDNGFIQSMNEAQSGTNINNNNPSGYKPLIITPQMNGDYVLEFDIPGHIQPQRRSFEFFDVAVANGNTIIEGRLWSKAWQLSSGSVSTLEGASYSTFYIYSNDSITTSFDSNGLAGGIWTIYSNEWGCNTSGTWHNRRASVVGNATVSPQYKLFLNDPDALSFPNGIIGEMISASVLPHVCDTVITFAATVSKGGNIEILIDVPPLNPNAIGPEDVQLGYSVEAGYNILLPPWDGKNAYGIPLTNGTQIEARINFLNGLTNIPLFDVEDNPSGFKVNLLRPTPVTGDPKLKLFWDDTKLPSSYNPTSNVIFGCIYSGTGAVSGCHEWDYPDTELGNFNTINSWWYYTTDNQLLLTVELELLPRLGMITGPNNICAGQQATFRTTTIPFAPKYIWHLSGPGISEEFTQNAPDTTFSFLFEADMEQGAFEVSVYGLNTECGNGEKVYFDTNLFGEEPPPIIGSPTVCLLSTDIFEISGSFTDIQWSLNNGDIISSPDLNPVTIRWHSSGKDTIQVYSTTAECGQKLSELPVVVNPVAQVGFSTTTESISCPGKPLVFTNTSELTTGTISNLNWNWDDGLFDNTIANDIEHGYSDTGIFNVRLQVTTDMGCQSEATKQIEIIPFPEASFSSYSNCISQSIELLDKSTGIDLETWFWDFGQSPVTASNLNLRQPTAVFHQSGVFSVKLVISNKYECRDTVVQQVIIHNPPEAAYAYDYPCQGAIIEFSDQSTPSDTSLIQFSWHVKSLSGYEQGFQNTPVNLVFDEATDYEVGLKVTDGFGCIGNVSSVIQVSPKPIGSFNYFVNIVDNQGVLNFENLTTGATDYYWDFDNGFSSTLFEPQTNYSQEREYSIMLVSISYDGCTDTTKSTYYFTPGLWMPNAFTPDGDGLNDVFLPVTNRTTLSPYLLQIYNRWGTLIFTSMDPLIGWDGTYNNTPCETGTYSFLLKYSKEATISSPIFVKRGHVTLLR